MHRSRRGIGTAVAVLLSLLVLGCTGGPPGPSRADLQPTNEASATSEPPATAGAGEDEPSAAGEAGGGGGPGGTAAPGGSGSRVPGAPVNPENRNNQPQARGAPIKVPAFQQIGAPIGEVLDSITAEFADACGGQLCVKLVIQPADADRDTCGFAGTDPAAGAEVRRGRTVTLVCNPAPTESSDTTTPDNTDPPDATQPDATTGPDDTQPTASF